MKPSLLLLVLVCAFVAVLAFVYTEPDMPKRRAQTAKTQRQPPAAQTSGEAVADFVPQKPELDWTLQDYSWIDQASGDGVLISGQPWHQAIVDHGFDQTLQDWPSDPKARSLSDALVRSKTVVESSPTIAWQIALNHLSGLGDQGMASLLGKPPRTVRYLPKFRNPRSKDRLRHFISKYGGRYSIESLADSTAFVASDGRGFGVWDIEKGEILDRFKVKRGYVRQVSVSPDKKWFAGGYEREHLLLWNRHSNEPVELKALVKKGDIELAKGGPLGFSSDSSKLLLIHYAEHRRGYQMRQPVIFDFASGEIKQLTMPGSDINMACFFPDGIHVLVALLDVNKRDQAPYMVSVNSETGKIVGRVEAGSLGTAAMSMAVDEPIVATSPFAKSKIQIWRGETLEHIADLDTKARTTMGLQIAPDGQQLVAVDNNGDVWQWDVTAKTSRQLGAHGAEGRAIAFTPNAKHVISSAGDNSFRIFDAFSLSEISEETDQQASIELTAKDFFALSPKGDSLAVCSDGGDIDVWDLPNGKGRHRLASSFTPKSTIAALAFSPDGNRLIAAGLEGFLESWNLKTGRQQNQVRLAHHTSRIASQTKTKIPENRFAELCFSRNGNRLAMAQSSFVRWFDSDLKEQAWIDNRKLSWLNGLETASMFQAVAINGDGSIVATATSREISVRRVDTGEVVTKIKPPRRTIADRSLSLSCDAEFVAASLGDETWVWNAVSGELVWNAERRSPCCFFDNAQQKLLVGSRSGTVHLVDLSDSTEMALFSIEEPIETIQVNQQGTIAVKGGSGTLGVFAQTDAETQRQAGWSRGNCQPKARPSPGEVIPSGQSYAQWWEQFDSDLRTFGPSRTGSSRSNMPSIPGLKTVRLSTREMVLRAWVYRPPGVSSQTKLPCLVYLPGNFSLTPEDITQCIAATGDDFVVIAPMLRGENGMDGNFELFLGEARDAREAARWAAKQPDIDADRIYAFGHSSGGGVSAMLSLLADTPIQHSASSGGLYPKEVFDDWGDIIPFRDTAAERKARLLIGNESHMLRDHHAFVGKDDQLAEVLKQATLTPESGSRLHSQLIEGDHFTSLPESLKRYIELIQSGK